MSYILNLFNFCLIEKTKCFYSLRFTKKIIWCIVDIWDKLGRGMDGWRNWAASKMHYPWIHFSDSNWLPVLEKLSGVLFPKIFSKHLAVIFRHWRGLMSLIVWPYGVTQEDIQGDDWGSIPCSLFRVGCFLKDSNVGWHRPMQSLLNMAARCLPKFSEQRSSFQKNQGVEIPSPITSIVVSANGLSHRACRLFQRLLILSIPSLTLVLSSIVYSSISLLAMWFSWSTLGLNWSTSDCSFYKDRPRGRLVNAHWSYISNAGWYTVLAKHNDWNTHTCE